MNFLLICSVYLSVFSFRTSINILEPVWSRNAITMQRALSNNFLHTKWVKLSLSTKAHMLFVQVTTTVEICLVVERNVSPRIEVVFNSLTDGLPKGMTLSLICINLKS